ncbi:general transcription factor 3C polypeptide 5 isoform X2 [Pseudomyrmex gracilis]|nr:general transcription factor 3C polypeptide 5 isoform X2 [Pseudomyrmex gracilis]
MVSTMSEASNLSDSEMFDKHDADFNMDYRHEIDSDDSFTELSESNINTEKNNLGDNKYVGPIIGGHRFDRKLVCVKYPGNVINADKAIETLGGITSISTTVDAVNRRLELRFRPDDGYSKPACGDRQSTIGFLLKVRLKKRAMCNTKSETRKTKSVDTTDLKPTTSCIVCSTKDLGTPLLKDEYINNLFDSNKLEDNNHIENNASINNQNDIQECINSFVNCNIVKDEEKSYATTNTKHIYDSCKDQARRKTNLLPFSNEKYDNLSQDMNYELPDLKILGKVDIIFKFNNLCDFQYVPMTQNKKNPQKLECIYNLIYPTGIPSYSWLKNDVPYFLPPAAFTRMDTVQQYIPKPEINSDLENIIGKNKRCSAGFPNYIYFTTPEVPSTPPKGIETAMKVKLLQNSHLNKVHQLFEERPIWSKNAIMHKTQFSSDQLKILLPSVAYYFMTGPWRIMWVKLGYDPRKDVNARKYQTLDYRLKAMHGLGSTVKCKRNYLKYTLPYKSSPITKQKAAIPVNTSSQPQTSKKDRFLHENVYIYREGTVPPSRQMFYQ